MATDTALAPGVNRPVAAAPVTRTRQATASRVRRGLLRAAAATAAAVLAMAALTVTASPAQAATPRCNGYGYIVGTYYYDWDIPAAMTSLAPVANPGPSMQWKCTMSPGANHMGVRALQDTLNKCYATVIGKPLKVDGSYGSLTQAALAKAQKWHKIKQDGIYGPQTAAAIYHSSYAASLTQGRPGVWGCARIGQPGHGF
ncbi:peptidoglycan-binding domain-containing protein [Catellatospora citrea]|uniref:peptidoglycan-binding domain-containing protein n=1 Tax=Catellatospora citrea TaxID=53366 RepID=UPI0033ED9DFD